MTNLVQQHQQQAEQNQQQDRHVKVLILAS
jgi:hypothetical protein